MAKVRVIVRATFSDFVSENYTNALANCIRELARLQCQFSHQGSVESLISSEKVKGETSCKGLVNMREFLVYEESANAQELECAAERKAVPNDCQEELEDYCKDACENKHVEGLRKCQDDVLEKCKSDCCNEPDDSDDCSNDCCFDNRSDHFSNKCCSENRPEDCSDDCCQENVSDRCQGSALQDDCFNAPSKQQDDCGSICCEGNDSAVSEAPYDCNDKCCKDPSKQPSCSGNDCEDNDSCSESECCGETKNSGCKDIEQIQKSTPCELETSDCAGSCCDFNLLNSMDLKALANIKVERKEPCESHLEKAMVEYLTIMKLGHCVCLEILERIAKAYEKSLLANHPGKRTKNLVPYKCEALKSNLVQKFCPDQKSFNDSCPAPCCVRIRAKRSDESNRDLVDCLSSSASVSSWKASKISGDTRGKRLNSSLSRSSGSLSRKRKVEDLEAGRFTEHAMFKVSGMTCTGCAKKVINSLKYFEGLSSLKVTFVTSTVEFDYEPDICDIGALTTRLIKETGFTFSQIKRNLQSLVLSADVKDLGKVEDLVEMIEKLGNYTFKVTYNPLVIGPRDILKGVPGATLANNDPDSKKAGKGQLYSLLCKTIVSAILTIPVLVLAWSDVDVPYSTSSIIQLVLATFVQLVAVPEFYIKALKSLIYSRVIEMDMLVVISITAAYVYSVVAFGLTHAGHKLEQEEFFETSTLLITLVLFGRLLATAAKVKAVSVISMRTLQTNSATIVEGEATTEIDSRLLQYGDVFLVKPHFQIVTDGVVIEGESTVDESMITGEATPIRKAISDVVIAGTLNGSSPLKVKVSRLPGNNSIADIAELVEKALAEKPKVQDLADSIAGYFVQVVLFISLLVLVIWIIINLKVRNKSGGGAFGSAISYSIAMMAISCPCALGLAVPMVLVVAGGVAARKGVLIKSSSVLERGCKITDIIFDKTGTLTSNVLAVEDAEFYAWGYSPELIKGLVNELTKSNDHPMSVAINKYLNNSNDCSQLEIPIGTNIESVPGSGISGSWNGMRVMVGNIFWLKVSENRQVLSLNEQNQSIVCATIGGTLAATFCMKAPLREEANGVIEKMRNKNITCHIVSGDNANAVTAVASSVGIPQENVKYQFSPAQKLEYVRELMQNGKKVLFCGDGTNDAVAVAQASVGVNLGTSSDITLATADVVLCGGLEGINQVIGISRRSFHIITFNFVWSFAYNLVAILAAAGAFVKFRIPPAYAGLGEVVSVLPVIFAAMTLVIG